MRLNRLFQISLFWRTFVLLVLLILASSVVWFFSFMTLEAETRALISARQISSAVNLTRSSLVHTDAIYRMALIKNISEQEGLHVRPREADDKVNPYELDYYRQLLQVELLKRLGSDTVISDNVNDNPGLWVSFSIQGDQYWLQTELVRIEAINSQAWLYWIAIAIAISLLGSAIIAGLLNKPLKLLSIALNHVRMGNFSKVKLRENLFTTELQDLNRGFNNMTSQLSKIETDRTVMLAGISHDLRTPLARLRLETELSVADSEARVEMSQDIDQINSILSKFLDYAKSQVTELQEVNLSRLVGDVAAATNNSAKTAQDISVSWLIPPNLMVMADPIELSRVLNNLLENARRYGKASIYPVNLDVKTKHVHQETVEITDISDLENAWSPTRMFDEPVNLAEVHIEAKAHAEWVVLTVKDHGSGVAPEALGKINVPFFRANEARSNVTGTGLGLAIVEKAVQGMQGKVIYSNWGALLPADQTMPRQANQDGGFMVEIHLKAPPHKQLVLKTKSLSTTSTKSATGTPASVQAITAAMKAPSAKYN